MDSALRSSIGALSLALFLAPVVGLAQTPPPADTPPAAEAPAAVEKQSPTDSAPAVAKPPPAVEPYVSHRELAGHVFIPSHFVLSPFSTTSFGMSLGAGNGTANGPALQFNPMTKAITSNGRQDYPFSAFGPALDVSARLFEFLELRLGINGFLFSGTSGSSALMVGSGFQFGGNLGMTGGLNLGENVRLGFTLDFVSTPAFNLLVLSGIQEAIKNGQPPNPEDLLSKSNTITVQPGLTAAWAPWRFIGGTLNFQYLRPQRTGSSSSSLNGLNLAALVDFDVMKVVHEVPLGVTAAYKWTAPIGASGVNASQDIIGGLSYTGRPNLALGLEIGERIFSLESGLKATALLFTISTQYYF
jgi:hypothetical protein